MKEHTIRLFLCFFIFYLSLFCYPQKVYAAEYRISSIEELKVHCENKNTETLILTRDLGLGTKLTPDGMDQVITVNGNKTIQGNGHQIVNYKTRQYANMDKTTGGNPIFGVNTKATLKTRNLTINGNRWGCKCKENSTIVVYDGTFYAEEGTVICQSVENGIQAFSSSRVNVKGNVEIKENAGAGIGSWGAVYVDGADIHDNGAGIHARGYRSKEEYTDIGGNTRIHDNKGVGLFIGSNATVHFHNGAIYHHLDAYGIEDYGECYFYGGSIHHNGNGVYVGKGGGVDGGKGTFFMQGGEICDNQGAGVYHCGITTITGGRFGNNRYDVEHYGSENNGNLVIEQGAKSIWLSSVGRYITTHSRRKFVISMPEECYQRSKILVHTDSGNTAKVVSTDIESGAEDPFAVRMVDQDVVIWDRYIQTTRHVKYDAVNNMWVKCLDDVKEMIWEGETYIPKFVNPPETYRAYALTRTNPNEKFPKDGETVSVQVNRDHIFYACYKQDKFSVHFDGNGATEGTMADQMFLYGVPEKLNKNTLARKFHITYDQNGGSALERQSDDAISDFTGWKVSAAAISPSFTDEQILDKFAKPGEKKTLYAAWKDQTVVLPNASRDDLYWEPSLGWCKYYFTGWYTEPAAPGERKGTCVGWGGDGYTPKENITLYAHWDYKVCVYYDGNTNDGGSMKMDDPLKGDMKPYQQPYTIKENGYSKEGYDFVGWNTIACDASHNPVEDGNPIYVPGSLYTQDIPLTLFAAWRNRFDIAYMGICQTKGNDFFDNNGGEDYSQLSGTIKLDMAEGMKIDTTKTFYDKEKDRDVVENVTGTGVGWAFAKDMEAKYTGAYFADGAEYTTAEFFAMAKDAGGITYGSASVDYQGTQQDFNSADMAVINMYRVWDYGPLVEAYDLYYTLEQARNGYITEEELLSHALATDEEDGIIEAGDHKKNSFRIWDYAVTDFTAFTTDGSVTETYMATDHAGNVTKRQVTIYITDTTPKKILPDATVRFLSEKYYHAMENAGGLSENSVWLTNPEYAESLEIAFSNEKNHTPQATYVFEHENILNMQEFVKKNGVCKEKSEDAQVRFYRQFMEPKMQK